MTKLTPPNAQAQPQQTSTLVRIGKAWIHQDKNGKDYLAISLDKAQYAKFSTLNIDAGETMLMFANKPREGHESGPTRDADYCLYIRQ